MKKMLLILTILATVFRTFAGDYFYNFTNGLVAYYPLDGNLADEMCGNSLANHGITFCTNRFGVVNGAGEFDGRSAWASSSVILPPVRDAFTLSCWLNIRDYDNVANLQNWYTIISKDGDTSLIVEHIGEATVLYVQSVADPDPNGPSFLTISTTTNLPTAGVWTHVVVTWDGMDFRFFFNGKRDTKTVTQYDPVPCYCNCPTLQVPQEPISLGDSFQSQGSPLKGQLSDVRVYNRALSLSEVVRLNNWEAHIQTLPPY